MFGPLFFDSRSKFCRSRLSELAAKSWPELDICLKSERYIVRVLVFKSRSTKPRRSASIHFGPKTSFFPFWAKFWGFGRKSFGRFSGVLKPFRPLKNWVLAQNGSRPVCGVWPCGVGFQDCDYVCLSPCFCNAARANAARANPGVRGSSVRRCKYLRNVKDK